MIKTIHKTLIASYLLMTGLNANTFTDKDTNLMWQDNIEVTNNNRNWQKAKVYCNKLDLDGYSDWRLPTVEELLGITDDNRIYPSIKSGIKNIGTETDNVVNAYWTSTAWKNFTANQIFCVDFGGGLEYVCKKSYTVFLTRCVRDNK